MEIIEYLKQTGWGEMLITFFVAMVPVIELRGAIPLGVGIGLHPWTAMIVSICGNMVPAPFIILFIRRVFFWLRRKSPKLENLISRLEHRADEKKDLVRRYKLLGLIILVAVPLPGTGVWTGALVAALMDLRMKLALPAIFIGVVIAGFLVTGLTFGVTGLAFGLAAAF